VVFLRRLVDERHALLLKLTGTSTELLQYKRYNQRVMNSPGFQHN